MKKYSHSVVIVIVIVICAQNVSIFSLIIIGPGPKLPMGGAPLVLAHVYHMNDATFLLTLGSSWSIEVDQFISRLRIVGLVWNLVCEFYGKWFAILCNVKTALERLVFWLPSTWLSYDSHAGTRNEHITPIKESKWAAKPNVSRRYWVCIVATNTIYTRTKLVRHVLFF